MRRGHAAKAIATATTASTVFDPKAELMKPTSATLAILLLALSPVQRATRDRATAWMKQAANALGGEDRVRRIHAIEIDGVSAQYQREQSERPEGPWVATYTDFADLRNYDAGAIRRTTRVRGYSAPDWVDNREWGPETTTLIVDDVGLRKTADRWLPAGNPWDVATMPMTLDPERVVIAALDASDLRAEPDVQLDTYTHHVVRFSAGGAPVRVFLNVPSMLPKAVEITRPRPYDLFWAPWGDVTQRVTFGVWTLEPEGVRFPRLWDYTTGGQPDGRFDITRIRINPPLQASDFAVPDDVRQNVVVNRRRVDDIPLESSQRQQAELAPGIVKVPGNWDIVEVKQDVGVAIVEGPLTSAYSAKVIEDAQRRFGGAPISAVVTTSDSWPHIGGMREYAARGVPIYALDLNLPILRRLFAAKYETLPDALARQPKAPRLHPVSAKTVVGSGANRFEIYPLRTVSGERQMMVYWPQHELLYTSDLFTLLPDGTVFLPQQVSEAVAAVERDRLTVQRAFGMHYDVVPWERVVHGGQPPRRRSPRRLRRRYMRRQQP
jgi:hypothetical protein